MSTPQSISEILAKQTDLEENDITLGAILEHLNLIKMLDYISYVTPETFKGIKESITKLYVENYLNEKRKADEMKE